VAKGFEGSRVRGFEGSRVRGFEGSRVRGFEGSRVRGFEGPQHQTEQPARRDVGIANCAWNVADNFGSVPGPLYHLT
jgi:hypothetical protein